MKEDIRVDTLTITFLVPRHPDSGHVYAVVLFLFDLIQISQINISLQFLHIYLWSDKI